MTGTFTKRFDETDQRIRQSLAWEIAEEGEEVPMNALLVSRRKPTADEIQRGIELAEKYFWFKS